MEKRERDDFWRTEIQGCERSRRKSAQGAAQTFSTLFTCRNSQGPIGTFWRRELACIQSLK